MYVQVRQLRDCIIAKSLIERQVSNAVESWEGTAASVHWPDILGTKNTRHVKPIKKIRIKSH